VVTPLRRASAKVLSDEETEVVFMNIAGLLSHHLRFLELVKERVSSWSPRSTIGDVFLFNVRFVSSAHTSQSLNALTPHAPALRRTSFVSMGAT
jgi:hypothetical protein